MKSLFQSIIFFVSIVLVFNTANASTITDPTVQEFSKVIYKEFDISTYGTTNLINKYGRMDVKTWDGNVVKIKVTILADAKSQSQADDVFNRVNINFYNDANFVKAETVLSETKGSWKMWNNGNNNDFSINYEVYYPRANFLDLSNRYGDTNIGYTKGAVKASIKYGNLNLESIDNNLECYLDYGDGKVGKVANFKGEVGYGNLRLQQCKEMNINMKYSNLDIDVAEKMNVNSRYSNVELGTVGTINYDGMYDNYKVKNVRDITAKTKYTNISIRALSNYADIDCDYGEIEVDEIGKSFSEIRIDASYTDIKLNAGNTSFQLDASTSYAGIDVPSGFNATRHVDKDNSETMEGSMGSDAKGRIKVRNSYSDIVIR
jgi:hypothetical protein